MKRFRHWTSKYIFNRAMNIWYQKRNPDHPWLTAQAIQILENWLRPTDVGIEWGSGRSTIWFARRISKLISIEHNSDWYNKTSTALLKSDLQKKVDYRYLSVDLYDRYVGVVDEFEDEFFDIVLVDGKKRWLCLEKGLPKLKSGGILVLDNSERYVKYDTRKHDRLSVVSDGGQHPYTYDSMNSWRTILTSNGVWETILWIKP